jgi:hypothetical protein
MTIVVVQCGQLPPLTLRNKRKDASDIPEVARSSEAEETVVTLSNPVGFVVGELQTIQMLKLACRSGARTRLEQ